MPRVFSSIHKIASISNQSASVGNYRKQVHPSAPNGSELILEWRVGEARPEGPTAVGWGWGYWGGDSQPLPTN